MLHAATRCPPDTSAGPWGRTSRFQTKNGGRVPEVVVEALHYDLPHSRDAIVTRIRLSARVKRRWEVTPWRHEEPDPLGVYVSRRPVQVVHGRGGPRPGSSARRKVQPPRPRPCAGCRTRSCPAAAPSAWGHRRRSVIM
jgi:hypothetical protein